MDPNSVTQPLVAYEFTMVPGAFLVGMFTGLGLIVAIGAQNAFVLRQGLRKSHVALVVAICAASDALLIILGVAGAGSVVQSFPTALTVFKWAGVAYLIWFGIQSLRSALNPQGLEAAGESVTSWKKVALTTLALTYLNPHVYLDTMIFLGSLSQQQRPGHWWFALGAVVGSFLWFSMIGFGASRLSGLMANPRTWRILDIVIACIMFTIAAILAMSDLGATKSTL